MFKEYHLGPSLEYMALAVRQVSRDFKSKEKEFEDSIRFRKELIPYLKTQSWTIRFKPNVIRMPYHKSGEPHNRVWIKVPAADNEWVDIGTVVIPKMVAGQIRNWPEKHEAITGSGWESKEHMVCGISAIYQPIYGRRFTNDDILIGYSLKDMTFYKK